jgi:hypothetical protein
LRVSNNTAATTAADIAAATKGVAHIYGRLGQGTETSYNTTTAWAFQWLDGTTAPANAAAAATGRHSIMFSVFPYDATDSTGLVTGATNYIAISAKSVDWKTQTDLAPMGTVAAATLPGAGLGAQALIASTLAAAGLVAMTL